MPRPCPLPPALGSCFSVSEARREGVSDRRLRNRDLDAPFRGVRAHRANHEAVDPEDSGIAAESRRLRSALLRRMAAYAKVAPGHSFFIGVSAAVAWGLPLPLRVLRRPTDAGASRAPLSERPLDVAVLAPHRALRATGVRGRQLSASLVSVSEHDGLRVASPASVWVQLASELSVDELIEVGDALVHVPRRRGMIRGTTSAASIEQLAAALSAGRREGAAKLRAALPQIRVGAASPAETRIRLACERAGLPTPELDFDVFADDGRPIGFTEIAYPLYRVLVEYEGDHHRRDRTQWNRDIEKHAACVAAGWSVVRLTAEHAYPSVAPAVARVQAALLRAGWAPRAEFDGR